MASIHVRAITMVIVLCSFAAIVALGSQDQVGGDTSLLMFGEDWIRDIKAYVKRQSGDEIANATLAPIDDGQTTTTKKPKKKKDKNKKKDKKKNKKKKSTPAPPMPMTTSWLSRWEGVSLGENLTINAYDETTYVYEKYNTTIEFNFTNLAAPVVISFEAEENEKFFRILSEKSVMFDPTDPSNNGSVTLTIKGRQLAITKLFVEVKDLWGNDVFEDTKEYSVKVMRVPRMIDFIFNIMLLPLILVTTAGMGCKMDFIVIRDKLKKPFQILVGPVCQFICQPFYAFCISKMLKLSGITAVGLITVGSCPGGGVSNMITLLLDADLILSVTMTFTSTCLAVGMLPINMLIYARHFLESEDGGGVNIPFGNIMMQIMMLTVPILVGMLVHYKLPKVAFYAIKSLNVLSLTMVLITLIIGIYSNLYIFNAEWQVLIGAFLLPCFGYITGFSVSKFVAKFPIESALTIMIETGVQNNLIAISMIKLSYPQPESDIMAQMPIFVVISSIAIALVMICVSVPINRKRRRERKEHAEAMKDVDDKYDKYEFEPAVRNGTVKSQPNGTFPTSPDSEVPPSYEEAEPFLTMQTSGKETIV